MITDHVGSGDRQGHAKQADPPSAQPSLQNEANSTLIMIVFLIGSAALLAMVSAWVFTRFSPQPLKLRLGASVAESGSRSAAPSTQPTSSSAPTPVAIVLPPTVGPSPWTGIGPAAPSVTPSAGHGRPARSTRAAVDVPLQSQLSGRPSASGGSTGPVSASRSPAALATAPGAPTNVIAMVDQGAATITWTAAPDGGSPITSYTVTPYIGTVAQTPVTLTGNPPPTTLTLTSLSNATYTFAVVAANAVGTGPSSASSNPIVLAAPTTPGAPTNVVATMDSTGTVATVTWTAPADGGSPITGYTVTPFLGTAAQTPFPVTGNPPATTATVTGLSPTDTYTFTVTATNAVGTGPASS